VEFLWGECGSYYDAMEFLHVKAFDGWRVMVEPYYIPSMEHENEEDWFFLLYKFKDE
jgi:hypothetical protein